MTRIGKLPTKQLKRKFALAFLLVSAPTVWAQDAREIVKKSVEKDQFSANHAKDYAWVQRVETHQNSSKDKDAIRTFESVFLYGRRFNRLIARNDKPLPDDEKNKVQAAFDKRVAEQQKQQPAREARREKNRERERAFELEIPDLYNFKLEGEDKIDGYDVWIISATPKPNYTPRDKDARPLQKFRGKLWIDKAEYHWVRIQAEVIEPLTWGLFIAKLNPGSTMFIEQTRVNDEIWLPKHQTVHFAARLVFKHFDMQQDITFRDYRKFVTDSKITGSSELGK